MIQNPELEQITNACKLFEIIDKKGNGKINKEELFNGLNELYKSDKLKDDVDKIFENLDINNDLYIEYEEFIRAAIDKSIFLTDSSLRFAFNFFDKNNRGEITVEDLCSIFAGDDISNEELDRVKKIVKKINPSEIIKYNEFCQIMKTFISPQ